MKPDAVPPLRKGHAVAIVVGAYAAMIIGGLIAPIFIYYWGAH